MNMDLKKVATLFLKYNALFFFNAASVQIYMQFSIVKTKIYTPLWANI